MSLAILRLSTLDDASSPAAAEIENAAVLLRRHSLRASGDRNGLARSLWHLATAARQRRPLRVAEALRPAGEPAR